MAGVDKLIVRNHAVLKVLPKAAKAAGPPGTRVTVKGYDIASQGRPWLKFLDPVLSDHMYVEYDDGREPLIARGGPSSQGLAFWRDGLTGKLRTAAEVTAARQSKDFGRGERILAQTFIPGRTAREVAQPAYEKAAQAGRGNNLYGYRVNSNSYAADAAEPTFGRRIGDEDTPGYETRLGDGELPEPVRRSQQALGQGLGATPPGMFLYRLGEELGKRSSKIPMLPGY